MKKIFTISILAIVVNAIAQIPTAGLVSHWRFNNSALDEVSGTNVGTITNATFSNDRNDSLNAALKINPTGEFEITDVNFRRIFDSNNSYSVNFWFKPAGNGFEVLMVCDGANNPPYKRTRIALATDSELGPEGTSTFGIERYNAANMGFVGGVGISYDTKALLPFKWYFLSFIYNGMDAKLFIDGVQLTNITGPTTNWDQYKGASMGNNDSETTSLSFGVPNQQNASAFSGTLDDIRIYNTAITQEDVMSLFDEGKVVTGIDLLSFSNKNISIFPNNTNDELIIESANKNASIIGFKLNIINSTGKVIYSNRIQEESKLKLNGWKGDGLYIAQLLDQQNNTVAVSKILLK